jgi:hypothetical protein
MDWTLEFGEQDWDHTNMALREFISNAIDSCGFENVRLEVVEKPRAKAGTTRIFIEYSETVQRYHENLDYYFLHWTPYRDKKFIPNTENEVARIYRKGVFIGNMDSYHNPSLFHYNLGDELDIDESRNINEWDAQVAAAKALVDDIDALTTFCRSLIDENPKWEHRFSKYQLQRNSKNLKAAWEAALGNRVVCDSAARAAQVATKGVQTVVVKEDVFEVFKDAGVASSDDKLSPLEQQGATPVPATPEAIETLDQVWDWLKDIEMTNGKDKPEYHCFTKVDEGTHLFGYQEGNKVYLNVDDTRNRHVALHELTHYITDAQDCTSTFQDFAFNVATRLGELLFT